jgi:hypothetical protein
VKTIAIAIIALALTGGAASAQYYYPNSAPVFVYQPQPDTAASSAILQHQLFDTASGAALQRNQESALHMQIMREQLRQMQQR